MPDHTLDDAIAKLRHLTEIAPAIIAQLERVRDRVISASESNREKLLREAEAAIDRERSIASEMDDYPCLTREQAEARIDQDIAEYVRCRLEIEAAENRIKQYVRLLDHEVTIRQIRDALLSEKGYPNTTTIWRLCKDVAEEGFIEPMSAYHGFATRVIPKRIGRDDAATNPGL